MDPFREDEAHILANDTTKLIHRLLGDFVKDCRNNDCLVIHKKSSNFAITMRLERKKEAK